MKENKRKCMNVKKISLGQFFTKESVWLKPQIKVFIKRSNCHLAYDPFAGNGDLLIACSNLGLRTDGLDIDKNLNWTYNDSLKNIPHKDGAIIITNPPYLSNYSASRKGIYNKVKKYFDKTEYDDLYLLALDKMLDAQDYVVAIIPETFINSPYKRKYRLNNITILEENPFDDTETPVCVACFDNKKKSLKKIRIYKNSKYINTYYELEQMRLKPKNNIKMKFNDKNGWLAVRCVDTTDSNDMIRFAQKDKINYGWEQNIKKTSRLLTLINIDIPKNKQNKVIKECNAILQGLRKQTDDVILSPFKGNMNNGERRRRLDYETCRAIIEKAYRRVDNDMAKKKNWDNEKLFNYCKKHREEVLDDAYNVEKIVITESKNQKNTLMEHNEELIKLITTYETLNKLPKKKETNTTKKDTIDKIYDILMLNDGINQSAFCQYWVTRNMTYSQWLNVKDKKEQKDVLAKLLDYYVVNRHNMYSSHGYTNTILQVVSDNYSQKRKGSVGINKYKTIIEDEYEYKSISDIDLKKGIDWTENKIVFYPDKGGKKLFNEFVENNNLSMHSRDDEHNKYPDIVIHNNNQWYIIELKSMKEGGGGQNKQIVEIANFIKYKEPTNRYHYITVLDGAYWNQLIEENTDKVVSQRNDVIKALKKNKTNYFVNSTGAKELLKNIL